MPFDPEPTPLCGRLLITETLIAQWLLGPWGKAPPKRGQEVGYVGDTMKRPAEEVEGKLHPRRAKVGTSTRPAVKPCSLSLEPEIRERGVIVRATTERPMVFALVGPDRQVVDAGVASAHQTLIVELPVLVAIAAKPAAAVVMPFVGEAHGDAVARERPHLLDEAVVELAPPFAGQERDDRLAAGEDFGAIAPAAVDRVGERDTFGIARIPGVLGPAPAVKGGSGGRTLAFSL